MTRKPKKDKRGGARTDAGKPQLDPARGRLIKQSITVHQDQHDALKRQPGGASAAVRRLIDRYLMPSE